MITAHDGERQGNSLRVIPRLIPLLSAAHGNEDAVMVDPRQNSVAANQLARERQELAMRWILLATIVGSVLFSSVATLLYGPPSLHFAVVQGTWATLLGWLVRKLFSD